MIQGFSLKINTLTSPDESPTIGCLKEGELKAGLTVFLTAGVIILGVTLFVFIRMILRYTAFLREQGKLPRGNSHEAE